MECENCNFTTAHCTMCRIQLMPNAKAYTSKQCNFLPSPKACRQLSLGNVFAVALRFYNYFLAAYYLDQS